MVILGINGGYNLPYENRYHVYKGGYEHDASACLLVNGKVEYAIEEERLTRIKHTTSFPYMSIQACLKYGGLLIHDIDAIAIMGEEKQHNLVLMQDYVNNQHSERSYFSYRELLKSNFEKSLDVCISDEKIHFINHHVAHASSSYYQSGFQDSLILAIDGYGDNASGMVLTGINGEMKRLKSLKDYYSLGDFYLTGIAFLGYSEFDEYKVMGLAPYGNAERYHKLFRKLYRLLPDGEYELYSHCFTHLFADKIQIRKKGEEFKQEHMDFAAGLQAAIEDIFMHIVKHYRQETGMDHLCLSGGVAQNCSINGKIYYSGLFQKMFIQPAAGDAGGSVGAALYVYHKLNPEHRPNKQPHTYLGSKLGDDMSVEQTLRQFDSFIEYQYVEDVAEKASVLLAGGSIIGWVQGRSEFGPRALGNRSIIADPRPPENKDIINQMVKKREAYRPFAPSVLSEYVGKYFEVPKDGQEFDYMNIVLQVREDKRSVLGAVTHINGSARVQTVQKQTNPLYWKLIQAFLVKTGVPILLNTSFNNNAEPIVDSCTDAVICFLTTKLDYLVVGNYVVCRINHSITEYDRYKIILPKHIQLRRKITQITEQDIRVQNELYFVSVFKQRIIDEDTYHVLSRTIEGEALSKILADFLPDQRNALYDEVIDLWRERYIQLIPRSED